MVRTLKVVALAGTLAFAAAPAFAQDLQIPGLDQLGSGLNGMTSGLDLDPFHIFTPAPAPAAAPMAEKPMMMHHHHHMMMHHKKKMMMHKKMMMKHKMMMKKM